MRHEIKSIRLLVKESADERGRPEDEEEFEIRDPLRFIDHPSERPRRILAGQTAIPRFPPAAPALLSTLTDPTVNGGATAPAGGRTPGSRARGSNEPADDDDSPDKQQPRSKARPSPSSRFR